jgi:hypothetical protein
MAIASLDLFDTYHGGRFTSVRGTNEITANFTVDGRFSIVIFVNVAWWAQSLGASKLGTAPDAALSESASAGDMCAGPPRRLPCRSTQ